VEEENGVRREVIKKRGDGRGEREKR